MFCNLQGRPRRYFFTRQNAKYCSIAQFSSDVTVGSGKMRFSRFVHFHCMGGLHMHRGLASNSQLIEMMLQYVPNIPVKYLSNLLGETDLSRLNMEVPPLKMTIFRTLWQLETDIEALPQTIFWHKLCINICPLSVWNFESIGGRKQICPVWMCGGTPSWRWQISHFKAAKKIQKGLASNWFSDKRCSNICSMFEQNI